MFQNYFLIFYIYVIDYNQIESNVLFFFLNFKIVTSKIEFVTNLFYYYKRIGYTRYDPMLHRRLVIKIRRDIHAPINSPGLSTLLTF